MGGRECLQLRGVKGWPCKENPGIWLHLMHGERNVTSDGIRDTERDLWYRCYVNMALKNGKDFRIEQCRKMF